MEEERGTGWGAKTVVLAVKKEEKLAWEKKSRKGKGKMEIAVYVTGECGKETFQGRGG